MEEEVTKVVYYLDEEETPYMIKLNVPLGQASLADFKNALQTRPNFKFFFKSEDDDFGTVKEEILHDSAILPISNGKVVSWLVSADGSAHSDSQSQFADNIRQGARGASSSARPVGGVTALAAGFRPANNNLDQSAGTSDTESTISGLPKFPRHGSKLDRRSYRPQYSLDGANRRRRAAPGASKRQPHAKEGGSSAITSDLETTSFLESEDDLASRISSSTDFTSVSKMVARQKRRRRRFRAAPVSRTSSFTSVTESSMSLNVIQVALNMDTVNFLGISIVGHSNTGGDGGIYVGSIMKGGAVALDGRIEPGDMILQVNDTTFENMSNDEAVHVLRDAVQRPGPIRLVVAKNWDPNPHGYFTIPRTEPVRPIDPGAWVAHTNAMREMNELLPADFGRPSSVTATSRSGSHVSSVPETERFFENSNLDLKLDANVHDLETIVRAMAKPESGLDVRDRNWLKITIPSAFIGSDVVVWLSEHVEGLAERRDARKYASRMLKEGYIRHTVNKITFSEQCYYVFGDLCGALSSLKINKEEGALALRTASLGVLPDTAAVFAEAGSEIGGAMIAAPPTTPLPSGGAVCWGLSKGAPPSFASSYNNLSSLPSSSSTARYAPAAGGLLPGGSGAIPTSFFDGSSVLALSPVVGAATSAAGVAVSGRTSEISNGSGGSGGSSGSSAYRQQKKIAGAAGAGQRPRQQTTNILQPGGAPSQTVPAVAPPTYEAAVECGSGPSGGLLAAVPELRGSKQSFALAMANPCAEYFVDAM